MQPDGRIVVSATGKVDDYECFINEWTFENCDELVVLRLSVEGDLDPTFSGDGVFAFGEDDREFEGGWLARDGDGFVVISGHRVARVTSGGALDQSTAWEGLRRFRHSRRGWQSSPGMRWPWPTARTTRSTSTD